MAYDLQLHIKILRQWQKYRGRKLLFDFSTNVEFHEFHESLKNEYGITVKRVIERDEGDQPMNYLTVDKVLDEKKYVMFLLRN